MLKQTDIKQLLDQLYSVSLEERTEVEERFANASDGEKSVIIDVLTRAKQQQDELFGQTILADPTFPDKLQRFLHDAMGDIKRVYEEQEKESASSILDSSAQ